MINDLRLRIIILNDYSNGKSITIITSNNDYEKIDNTYKLQLKKLINAREGNIIILIPNDSIIFSLQNPRNIVIISI